MAGARPPGAVSLANVMYNDDEDENSADSVEQAALEGACRDESLLDPDSLMFEELDDDRPQMDDDEDEEEDTTVRKRREYDEPPTTSTDPLFDETDSIINTPYGSPLSDISSISNNQKWIGEVKKMLLDDQRKTESRTKTWLSSPAEPIPSLSSPIGSMRMEPLEGHQWGTQMQDTLPDMGFNMHSAEDLAEKYSNDLIEKDLAILEKDKRISNLEKSQRDLESTLEDCQKELRIKSEAATSGVEKLKRTLEEKDKCIMETSERLRKVTESYNSSEKRWKEQQDFLEKQIQKLKSDLEEKGNHDEELKRLAEDSVREKEELEQQLEQTREEIDFLKQQFADKKKMLEDELRNLKDEKTQLENKLREEIGILQNKLTLSEQAFETALNEKETFRVELESQEEKNRILSMDIVELQGKDEIISQQEMQKVELEKIIADLRQQMKDKQEHFENSQLELQIEKEAMQKEIEETKEQLEAASDDHPVNFFKQDNEAATTEPWTDTKKTLEDRIAELELEKGNLLLQLVDVDEHEQQEAHKNAETAAVAEEGARQLESLKEALQDFEQRNEILEKELEESKTKESQRIENAMNTIAWEEKYEELQKANQTLMEELQNQRRAADELSGRYEDLEKKCTELELGKPPIEGLADIDKCDGWSDGTPQLPDEGFTEMETQISELKASLEGKQNTIDEMLALHKSLEDKLLEKNLMVSHFETKIEEITAEKVSCSEKLQECLNELECVRQELLKKAAENQLMATGLPVTEPTDGWNDDPPILLDEGFNDDNQVAELKQELSKKDEALSATSEKCKTLEDKLKKALRALKQKNDRLAELKNRLGDDVMTTSTVSSMEASMVLEPVVGKSITSDLGSSISPTIHLELDRWKRECEEKETKIRELEAYVKALQDNLLANQDIAAEHRDTVSLLVQRDVEIEGLRNNLTILTTSLDSKNEEVDQLMKACEEMQKSIDEKVGLLNECVSKKDIEVRQAISQYEDFLKDATLNVSHLTKELEEKIREINSLQAQLLDAQQQTLEVQNEYDRYRADNENGPDSLEEKEMELEELKKAEAQVREDLSRLSAQLNESYNNHFLMNEALDRAEAEKKQLREECLCIQNEYGNKSKELQVQVSQLIDQLNEREAAISVMEARLKESDEQSDRVSNEIRYQLEEKSKTLEQTEQSLFVKTEECVRLEERIRELEESYRKEINTKIMEVQEQHRVSWEAYAAQTSDDLERTCEQLAKKNSEVTELQETYRRLQEQLAKIQGDYDIKCSEFTQAEQWIAENNTLKSNIQAMQETIESYTQALNTVNGELNAKINEVDNLHTICTQYEEKCFKAAVANEDAQRTLQETQATLSQCQQDVSVYYGELQASKREVEDLRNTLAELHQTIGKLNHELSETKTEAARQVSENQNITNQWAKYQEMEANLNRYLEDLNSATEELGKRNSEYRELDKSYKAQEIQIQSLQGGLEATRRELGDLQRSGAEKDELISRFESQVVELQAISQNQQGLSPEQTKALLEELEEKKREISDLRFELEEGIIQEKRLKEHLESRENEIRQLQNVISEKDSEIAETWQSWKDVQSQPLLPEEVVSTESGPLMERLEQAEREKEGLERKIDLLHNKLEEVEASEVKCYEDFSKLKILRTELEMDNLGMSAELEQLRRSFQDGDNDPKYKSMENQLILMSKTLEDRDKLCRDLMKNISQLQESYDALRIRVNSMTMPQPFALSPDSLEAKFVEQDRDIFSLRVDLEREKKIRELYEGQLFLATSKKQFDNSTRKSTSSGSWFGLGELFSPSPPRPSPAPSIRSHASASLAPSSIQNINQLPITPYGGRPLTPITPATAFSASLFENSGLAGEGQQQQFFMPQGSPGPSSAQGQQYFIPQAQPSPTGQGTQPAQSSSTNVVESPYANVPIPP